MTSAQDVQNVLQGLRALQNEPLSIIKLSEPISGLRSSRRTSDISTSTIENDSPASLEADLTHYKELFSKLRFSYLEQVTKEKFLRAIVGDPPLIADNAENIELERQLADVKGVLKAQKEYVADMVAELDAKGRDLSQRYETISLQTTLLSSLPPQIEDLDKRLASLRSQSQSLAMNEDNPYMAMPLPATLELVENRERELDEVNTQINLLQQALSRQTRTVEIEEREVKKLEAERNRAVSVAREAIERKQEGGGADDIEMKGRWLSSVESGLKKMLEVDA